jgi:hypothetical protein
MPASSASTSASSPVRSPSASHSSQAYPAFQGTLLEDGGAQRVDRRHLGPLHDLEGRGGAPPLGLGAPRIGAGPLQALAHAQLQDGGRVLGEGDGRDLLQPRMAAEHEGLDTIDEQRGLARARARLEHEASAELPPRGLASVVVDGAEGHHRSRSLRYRVRRRSASL